MGYQHLMTETQCFEDFELRANVKSSKLSIGKNMILDRNIITQIIL